MTPRRLLVTAVLLAVWPALRVLAALDDLVMVRYDADDLDEWAQR
jgi:hypothetical protein